MLACLGRRATRNRAGLRILVVAATQPEIAPLVTRLHPRGVSSGNLTGYSHGNRNVDVLTTGVGMVATAAWCGRLLSGASYDLVLNLGVCGSFDRSLTPGMVVHVASDRIAELGAEDGERFVTVQELRLLGEDEFPFRGGLLVNRQPPSIAAVRALPEVAGITVNTVHGREESITAVIERFNPQVESMEGAGFMYACLIHDVAFAQVRAVSNVVERRNRAVWRMREAVDRLCQTAVEILESA